MAVWVAEAPAARGTWIKDAETGEWCALALGDTDESAARHARLISAAPKLLDLLQRWYAGEYGYGLYPLEPEVRAAIEDAGGSVAET